MCSGANLAIARVVGAYHVAAATAAGFWAARATHNWFASVRDTQLARQRASPPRRRLSSEAGPDRVPTLSEPSCWLAGVGADAPGPDAASQQPNGVVGNGDELRCAGGEI